jgi:Zn-dependent metalloprotease
MVSGDGDGRIFVDLTRPLEVVAHELAHGVIAHTSAIAGRRFGSRVAAVVARAWREVGVCLDRDASATLR